MSREHSEHRDSAGVVGLVAVPCAGSQ